jgi:hypothetical protein
MKSLNANTNVTVVVVVAVVVFVVVVVAMEITNSSSKMGFSLLVLLLGALQIIRDTLVGLRQCHQMTHGGGSGSTNMSCDIFGNFWVKFHHKDLAK